MFSRSGDDGWATLAPVTNFLDKTFELERTLLCEQQGDSAQRLLQYVESHKAEYRLNTVQIADLDQVFLEANAREFLT